MCLDAACSGNKKYSWDNHGIVSKDIIYGSRREFSSSCVGAENAREFQDTLHGCKVYIYIHTTAQKPS